TPFRLSSPALNPARRAPPLRPEQEVRAVLVATPAPARETLASRECPGPRASRRTRRRCDGDVDEDTDWRRPSRFRHAKVGGAGPCTRATTPRTCPCAASPAAPLSRSDTEDVTGTRSA